MKEKKLSAGGETEKKTGGMKEKLLVRLTHPAGPLKQPLVPVLVAGDPVRDVGDRLPVALFVPEATC